MGTESTTKIRLVRCPKCSKVLPELPDFNVYKCGGCGATLQAKHRVNIARSTESGAQNRTDRVQEGKECSVGDDDKDVRRSSDDCSSFQNHESDQSQSGDCDAEQPRGMNLSIENQSDRSRHSNSLDCDNEGSEVSNDVFSPTDFVDDKSEEFAPNGDSELNNLEHSENEELADSEEESVDDENKAIDDRVNEQFAHYEIEEFVRQTENEESSREFADYENELSSRELSQEFANGRPSFRNCEPEVTETEELADNEDSADDENIQNEESRQDFSVKENKLSSPESSPELEHHEEQEESTDDEEKEGSGKERFSHLEAEENEASRDFDRPENKEFTQEINAANGPPENGFVSRANPGAGIEQESSTLAEPNAVKESKKSVSNVSNHVPAKESFVSRGSELKQPEKSVHWFHGRLSSEEFNPSSKLHSTSGETPRSPARSSHGYDASISSYEGTDDQLLRRQIHSFADPHKAPNFLPQEQRPRRDKFLEQTMMMRRESDTQHHGLGNDKWGLDEFLESAARYDQTARNWRPERRGRQSGYETGGPSNRLPDKFQRRSSFQPEWSEDPEQMMKLLKMVFEMRNQREPRYDHRYNAPRERRYGFGSNYPDRHGPRKIPFSAEAIGRSHKLDPTRAHYAPQPWSHSAQLPHTSRYDAAGLCGVHPGHGHCTCYNASFPPSPQWSVDSEAHRRRSQDGAGFFSRERHRAAKRHLRPVSGGAPLLVCYKCHALLQLPADFLLFKRKCHRLKCGACSEVLKFSLDKGSRIVPYRAKIEEEKVERRNEGSMSQTPRSEPVACSDDYSHRKSCSAEEDSGSNVPFQTPLGRAFDRILFGSCDPSGESKEFVSESSGISKSKKPSSETGDEGPRSTSPLHRLMGYSSPSQVILGSRPYGRETSSSYSIRRDK